jgi:hypothetical protein
MMEPPGGAPPSGNEERPNLVAVPAQDLSGGQMSFDAVNAEEEVQFRISTDALRGEDDLVSENDAERNVAAGERSGEVGVVGVADVAVAEPEVADVAVGEPSVSLIADLEAQPVPYESPPAAPVDDPSLQERLARIHLRTGSLTLACAELETLAGRNQLDTAGRLDLAEARWRTGDLHGAGEAASAYLAANGEEVLGFVIAAEAAAMANRVAEARSYVEQAMQRYLSDLDPVFAGMARKAMWSIFVASPAAAPVPQAAAPEPAPEPPAAIEPASEPVAANAEVPEDPTIAEADGEVASGRSYLEGNDPLLAALHFGVALRLNKTRASVVIEAIGDRQDMPLQMVRGEAVRLLGVASDAGAASQSAVVETSAPVVEAGQPSAPLLEPAVEPEPPGSAQGARTAADPLGLARSTSPAEVRPPESN